MKRLLTALALAALPLPALAQGTDMTDLNAAERDAFRAEVRAYLLENPEVLLEAIDRLEQRQAEQQQASDASLIATNAEAIFADGHSWVGGNPDGDIALVEFLDYRCGYCRRAYDEVMSLVDTDGDIRFIVKEFPILGEESVAASRMAIATKMVAGDEAYYRVHDALMTFNGRITENSLTRLAEQLDLDADAIIDRMDSPEITEIIEENRALAQRLQITGTPTFVLEDQMLRGYVPLEQMTMMVDRVRDAAPAE